MSGARSSPFSPRVALAMVLGGTLAFLALLWAVGSGMADPEPEPSGAHVDGKGLVGFAALAEYLEARGFKVRQTRSRGLHRHGGLLVLTPRHDVKTDELTRVIDDHRAFGPTLLIMPKWMAMPVPPAAKALNPGARKGFVELIDPVAPEWKGFHDEVSVELGPLAGTAANQTWRGADLAAPVADPRNVLSGKGRGLVPLVVAGTDMRMLAGFFADGTYPGLARVALAPVPAPDDGTDEGAGQDDTAAAPAAPSDDAGTVEDAAEPQAPVRAAGQRYPLIVVFDPDLFNNYGMAHQQDALLAERLIGAAAGDADRQVTFDLTLAGYGRSESLLELAFTPPFLAATLCLLLAAAVALWRAYHRFGPPLLAARSIAFGKRALVVNAAGLVRRAKRLHLLGAPYADAARERLARALALPARLEPAATEAAIDRALHARTGTPAAFSAAAAALRAARRPRDMLRAAQTLNSLERTLLR